MPEPARNTSLDAQREPHFPDLFPGEVRLFRDASNRLRLTVEGQRSYLDVKVVRAFPLSDPDGYIGFLDGKDKLIGLIREPDALDAESLALARKDMHRRYFTPHDHGDLLHEGGVRGHLLRCRYRSRPAPFRRQGIARPRSGIGRR